MTEAIQDLSARKAKAEARLSSAREARAAAVLAGGKIDGSDVEDAEREVAALIDAQAAQERHAREATQRERAARHAQARENIRAATMDYADAYGRAEDATRKLAKAIRDIRAASAGMSKNAKALGRPAPHRGNGRDAELRLTERIVAVLKPVIGHPCRFGRIEFLTGITRSPDEDWRKDEADTMARSWANLLEDKQ